MGDENAVTSAATVVTTGTFVSEPLSAVLAQQERTLAWLARKTGKSPSYVTRVLQRKRKPSEDFKTKAAEALGVPATLIFPVAAEAEAA